MGFSDHGIVFQNIRCMIGVNIRKRFVLLVTLASWITSASAQDSQSNSSASLTGSGIFTSPNYPLSYPDNANYTWCLQSNSNDTNIRLKFTTFTTELHWDALHIYDEKGYLTSFSGDTLPPVVTLGKTARLVFSSDHSVNRTGFNASFSSFNVTDVTQCTSNETYWCTSSSKCINLSWRCDRQRDCYLGDDEEGCPATATVTVTPQTCGRTILDSGYIQSPNYPQGYPNNIRCSWRLVSKSNDAIARLRFNDFFLENLYDFVDVYDERNISHRYTGNVLPPTITLGKEARIEFFSDQSNVRRGFRAEITFSKITSQYQCMTNDAFWCTSDQKCISSNWRCDGYPDCKSRDDEVLCSTTAQTTTSPQSECSRIGYFWCSTSLKCIRPSYRCDYYQDCTYGEDEANCLRTTISPPSACQPNRDFWCSRSLTCIPLSYRCDRVSDCLYAEDEVDCPRTTLSPQSECHKNGYYWCSRSLRCVPLSYRCNNFYNCLHGEDEANCSNEVELRCPQMERFWCETSRQCISLLLRCNGKSDCLYAEDEQECASYEMELRCQQMQRFWCKTSRQCTSLLFKCDGKSDCLYAEDEQECATPKTGNTTATVAESVFAVVGLVLVLIISVRIKKVCQARRENVRHSNYVPPVWSEPHFDDGLCEALNPQAVAPQDSDSLPMDQYAPPSYDATMIAYSNGEYVNRRAKFV